MKETENEDGTRDIEGKDSIGDYRIVERDEAQQRLGGTGNFVQTEFTLDGGVIKKDDVLTRCEFCYSVIQYNEKFYVEDSTAYCDSCFTKRKAKDAL